MLVKLPLYIIFCCSDSRSVQLKNTKGNIQRGVGKALYNVHESLPGDWQTFTDNNIRLSEQVTVRPRQFARGLADFHR
jgi:hypothetical protein